MEELFKKDAVYGPIVGRKANGMVDVNYGGTIITLPESENELNFSARLMFAAGGSLYQQRVADNLKHMQTDAAEWKMVPVLEMQTTLNDKGEEVQMPIFDFSVTKGFVKAPTLYPAGTATGALTNCELCNKSIKRVFWIYNPEKKYILQVGSECVTHFGEGKSGKEQVREKQIADALLLDKQLLHLQQVIKQKASKMVTENLGYGRSRSVRKFNHLNLKHWLSEPQTSEPMQKLQNRLKGIDTEFFKNKKHPIGDYLNTWQQVIELLQPFNYAAELQYAQTPAYKDKQTYTPTIAEAEAAANKKLLAWYSRKGEAQKQAAEKVTALLKAYDYWEPQELASGGYLSSPKKLVIDNNIGALDNLLKKEERILYRGVGATGFSPNEGAPIFLTPDYDIAKSYSENGEGKVLKFKTTQGNVLDLSDIDSAKQLFIEAIVGEANYKKIQHILEDVVVKYGEFDEDEFLKIAKAKYPDSDSKQLLKFAMQISGFSYQVIYNNYQKILDYIKSLNKYDYVRSRTEDFMQQVKGVEIIALNPQKTLKLIGELAKGGTATPLLAPNGKPSNLTPEQYRLVRTPQFKAWFGDWENDPANASKVVDENGEPMVVYHGSDKMSIIKIFKSDKGREYNFFSKDRGESGRYITDYERVFPDKKNDKDAREKYYDSKIKPFFLKSYKIFNYNELNEYEIMKADRFIEENKDELFDVIINYIKEIMPYKDYLQDNDLDENISKKDLLVYFLSKNSDDWWILETPEFQQYIKSNGYDSFITHESGNLNIAVYNTENIKLADGTNTTFNADNPDIRFEEGGSVNANCALLAPNGKPSNLTPEQYRLVRTPQFKAWFGDWEKLAAIKFTDPAMDEVTLAHLAKNVSKMVDENGEPLVCFHGTNRDFTVFEERGHAHDRGYYGTGFYFTFQKYGRWMFEAKSEAAYYGNKIIHAFLKSISPFDISQLSVYKGHSINYIGTEGLIFLWNVAKKFPGIADSIFVKKKGKYNSEENEYTIEEVPISVLPSLFEKYAKELKTYESYDELHNETKVYGYVKSEIVEYDYTEKGGKKGSYEDHDDLVHSGFLKNQHPPAILEAFFIEAAISKYDGIEADYYPEGYMTRNPQITETIKKEHDAIVQGATGDEVVVFKPTQIKLADGTNTTFNADNPDIRFEDGGKVTYPKTITVYHGTCASNANQLIKNGWKPNLHESGANQGNSKYLYVSSMAEDALWFAENAGCNTIVKIENVPVSNLLPDPEDESGYTINDLLQRIDKGIMPAKFILHQPLEASYFSVYKKEYAEGGITGGKAEGKSLMDIAAAHGVPFTNIYHEWQQGIQVELEHTPNAEIAAQIARDHLVELPDYYSRLKKMEEDAKKEKQIKQFAIPAGFERYYEYVPVDEILPYKEFDRSVEHKWNKDDLQKLIESIKNSGIYEPLTLQVSGTKALLVEGNTRLAAAQKLGLKYIPVSVSNKTTSFKGTQAKKAKPLPRPAVDYDKARYVGIADQNIERSALAHGFSALLPADIATTEFKQGGPVNLEAKAVLKYQWMRNKQGGQQYGNQQIIVKEDEEIFEKYARPLLNKTPDTKNFAAYSKKYGKHYASFIRQWDSNGWKLVKFRDLESLKPHGEAVKQGWVIQVNDFSSPEAVEHGLKADSDYVTCKKCGWQWNIHDSDPSDKYICHKCGTNNRP